MRTPAPYPNVPRAIIIITTLLLTATAHAGPTVWYVNKANTNPTQDGTTWPTAFTTIQPAIDAASEDDEVWVAAGVYDEQRTFDDPQVNQESGTLNLRDGIVLLGGFYGDELDSSERDYIANATVIDGSKARDGEAAFHVLRIGSNTVLDGFGITGGDATGLSSGGIDGGGSNILIRNCDVYANAGSASSIGIGGNNITVEACTFRDNLQGSERYGGGIITGTSITVKRCMFRDNEARFVGGLALNDLSSGGQAPSQVVDSVFIDNHATREDGAISISGNVRVENCLFVRNTSAVSEGAGAISHGGSFDPNTNEFSSSGEYVNCTFVGNSSPGGSVLRFGSALIQLRNCIVWGNEGPWLVESFGSVGALFVSASVVQTDNSDYGNAALDTIINDDPLFVNPIADDYHLLPGSPAIDAGASADPVDTDLDGRVRPLGDDYDIGAYEFDPENPTSDPFDATGDSEVNAADIQHLINQVLASISPITDLNGDGTTNASDIQLMINRVLGLI